MGLKENIKKTRLERELTLEDVGRHLQVSKQTVQKYESGIVTNVPSDKIELMAKLFKVSPAYLMGWVEPPYSSLPDGFNDVVSVDAKTGKLIKLERKEINDILSDILDLPDEALDALKDSIEFLKYKYTKE